MPLRRIVNFKKQWSVWPKFQRKSILQAMVILHITPVAMRIVGVQHWITILGFFTPINNPPLLATATELEQVHWLNIQAVNHSLIRGKCLSRSINLWWLMRRHNIDTELRIGVRHKSKQFKAHAWLEYQGQPINADQNIGQHFRAFDKLSLNKGL